MYVYVNKPNGDVPKDLEVFKVWFMEISIQDLEVLLLELEMRNWWEHHKIVKHKIDEIESYKNN